MRPRLGGLIQWQPTYHIKRKHMKHPWHKYKVGKPSMRKNWVEPTCREFPLVSHIAHLESAISIVRHKVIRPTLIQDDSKLKRSRILVAWLSPNHWPQGSIYGGISFDFDWKKLISERKHYWVESIETKGQQICRFLITNVDRDSNLDLIVYDPERRDGPWWYDSSTKTHWYNGEVTMEFMVEDELKVADASEIDFVRHHESICSQKNAICKEKGMRSGQASALFLAGVVGNRLNAKYLASKLQTRGSRRSRIKSALNELLDDVASENRPNPVLQPTREFKALARAVLVAYFRRDVDETHRLISFFNGKDEELAQCLSELVDETFGL